MCKIILCKDLFEKKLNEINVINNFYDYFSWLEKNYKNNIMFEYDKKKYTGEYFFEKANIVSTYLSCKLKNIKKNSWVGIQLKNHPVYVAILWGVLKSGFNVLLVDDNLSQLPYNEVINQSKISAIITDTTDNIINKNTNIITLSLNDILLFNHNSKIASDFIAKKIALCSSGTEGNIKISVYNEDDFLEAVKKSILGIKNTFCSADDTMYSDDKILISPPFFHIFGLLCLFVYITVGITIVVNKDSSLSDFMSNINDKNIRFVAHVPAILVTMFKFISGKYKKTGSSSFKENLGERLRFFIGAGVSADDRIRKILNQMGIIYIDCYGSTETGIISANNVISKRFDTDIRVLVEEKLSSQGSGEILIGGKGIRSATLENGQEIIPKEKYVKTGDIAKLQGDNIFITGRNNDIIIGQNGLNIIPKEIENYFDFLNDCSYKYTVLGMDDFPVLVICCADQTFLDPHIKESLINSIIKKNNEIDIAKRVVAVYFTFFDFPITTSMKIKKNFLREKLNDGKKCEKIILINKNNLNQKKYTENSIKNDIKKFLSEYLNINFDSINGSSLVIEELGTDSVILAELFVYINKKYCIKLDKKFFIQPLLTVDKIACEIYQSTIL